MEDAELAKTVGANVRAAREAAGLTQAELGRRAKMRVPNISRLENGNHLACLETLNRIAKVLGVEVEAFLKQAKKGKK